MVVALIELLEATEEAEPVEEPVLLPVTAPAVAVLEPAVEATDEPVMPPVTAPAVALLEPAVEATDEPAPDPVPEVAEDATAGVPVAVAVDARLELLPGTEAPAEVDPALTSLEPEEAS